MKKLLLLILFCSLITSVNAVVLDYSINKSVFNNDFFGTCTHGYYERDTPIMISSNADCTLDVRANVTWHREKLVAAGLKNNRGDAALSGIMNKLPNGDAEQWTNITQKQVVNGTYNTTDDVPYGWDPGYGGVLVQGNITRSTTARSGQYSVNLSARFSSVFSYYSFNTAFLQNNTAYNFSVWVFTNVTGGGRIAVKDTNLAWFYCPTVASTVTNDWQMLSCTFNMTNFTSTQIRFLIEVAVDRWVAWDDASIKINNTNEDLISWNESVVNNRTSIYQFYDSIGGKYTDIISYMPEGWSRWDSSCNGDKTRCQPYNRTEFANAIVKYINKTTQNGMYLDDVYYEIWNEPDLRGFWNTNNSEETRLKDYLLMYDEVQAAIKNAYPTAKVGGPAPSSVLPSTAGYNITKMFIGNFTGRYDFLSIHKYPTSITDNGAGVLNVTGQLYGICNELGINCYTQKVFLNEFNYGNIYLQNNATEQQNYSSQLSTSFNTLINGYPNVSVTIYQWTDQYPYASGTSACYPEYPNKWAMVEEIQMGERLYTPYNLTKDYYTYLPNNSVIKNSTVDTNLSIIAYKTGNEHRLIVTNYGKTDITFNPTISGISTKISTYPRFYDLKTGVYKNPPYTIAGTTTEYLNISERPSTINLWFLNTSITNFTYNDTNENTGAVFSTTSSEANLWGFNVTTKVNNLWVNNITFGLTASPTFTYVLNSSYDIICKWNNSVTSPAGCLLPTTGTYYILAGNDGNSYTAAKNGGGCTTPTTGVFMDFKHASYGSGNYTVGTRLNTLTDGTTLCWNIQNVKVSNTRTGGFFFVQGNTSFTIYNTTLGETFSGSTTNGTYSLELNKDTSYNITINNPNYAIINSLVTTNSSETINLTYVFNTSNTITINLYDELTENYITNENITVEIISDTYSSNTSVYRLANFTLQAGNYTIRYRGNSWSERDYYITLTNNSYNYLSLYDLSTGNSSIVTITVKDTTGEAIEGATVKLLRYFVTCNCYRVVQMDKTNNAGEGLFYVQAYNGHYKWIIEYQNNVVFVSTTPEQITDNTKAFIIDLGTNYYGSFERLGSITSGVTYNNNTKVLTFTWNDPTNIVTRGCLEATKVNGTKYVIESSSCGTGSTGSTYIVLTHADSTKYLYKAYIDTSTAYSSHIVVSGVIEGVSVAARLFGTLGVLLAAIVMVTLSIMFSNSATAVIAINIIGLVFVAGLGLLTMSSTFIILFAFVGIGLIFYFMRT